MLVRYLSLALLALLIVASPARAYTPENGVWWNPNEPGTGMLIEIQDNFLFAAVYSYDAAGFATWYTTAGFLTGNARYDGQLDAFRGGPCLSCSWRPNTAFLGNGGPIRIDFNSSDPTKAMLSWGGRTFPIERFQFYLKRPEDGARPLTLTKMLGEWSLLLDFSDDPDLFPFYGELLIFEDIDLSEAPGYVEGCRAGNSIDGFCRNVDLRDHDATGYYDTPSREHVFVVNDSANTFVVYIVRVGTNDMEGEFSVYFKGDEPSVFFPLRGFRSASRSFVEEGVGPSKADPSAARSGKGIGERIDMQALSKQLPSTRQSTIPAARFNEIRRQLEAKLSR
ncbi:hypothetical protein [Pseudomarimonas arenosa]|uniref:Uncharacterized protein n=1 Tax=Pseudomarimonas arenosa TaxID=2774145 RepID=A0AAW3ZMV5_9GAMM|nr:hypothetical protein [Pseudomarimonas arenosa]MBD8526864.1 hypothetical protein [Pseudomarimonas arenosa]